MVQNQEQPVGKITFSILIALSLSHCLNDLLQSVVSAAYPLFKDDLGLSFAQIGLITLVYQLSASVFQPITGIIFDKYPVAWSLPIGMSFTLIGLINLAFSDNLYWILAFVALAAIGVMYPICKWYKSYLNRMKAQTVSVRKPVHLPLPMDKTALSIAILLILIFSKYIYMASLTSYYTFYLIHKFNVSVQDSQLYLFIFLVATAIGTLIGGPVGDRIGRKYVIWASILGAAPFSLLMPHANLMWTIILSFCVGLMLSSAFPAILLYAQELLPTKLGLISGLFFGFAFGVAGVASAVLGNLADKTSIEYVYNICAYMPLLGLVTFFLPNLKKKKIE